MKKKYISVMFIALLSLSGTIALAAHNRNSSFIEFLTQPLVSMGISQSAEKEKKKPVELTEKTVEPSRNTDEIPGIEKDKKDLVTYYVLFRFAQFLEKEAQKAELAGKDASEYRQHFIKQAKLTPEQN